MLLKAILLICSIYEVLGQENAHDYLHAFREDLFKAANQVMALQEEPRNSFPDFNMPVDFMHSFIPDSGVGNREDLVIDAIRSVPVYYDDSYLSWRYERFNNSDYVMGLHKKHLFLWKTSLTDKLPFQFSSSDTIFQYTSHNGSVVLDAVMFSRYVLHLERLYVAILSRNYKSSTIGIYEIVDSKGLMVTVIDLNRKGTGEKRMEEHKLAYVQSQHAGSLVVLMDSNDENKLVYQKKGSSPLSHYIEVHCRSAVDLVSFNINGHGYIAVAGKSLVEVFKMNDFLQNHITFERFPYSNEVTDLEYFRLGFHHYLAVSALKHQTLYVWKSGGFFSKQEFRYPEAQQWFSALLPTCRDDIILFLIQNMSTEVFVWNGQTEKFAIVKDVIPMGFSPRPGSLTSFSYTTTAFLLYAQSEVNTSIFSITTYLKPMQDPVLLAGKEAATVMKQLQATVEHQEAQLQEIESILAVAVRRGLDPTFTAPQAFIDLQATVEVTADNLKSSEIEWIGSDFTSHQYEEISAELESHVIELERRLRRLEESVRDVLLWNKDSKVTGSKVFTGKVQVSSVLTSSLSVDSAGELNVKTLQSEIYRLDRPRLINGILTLSRPMTVSGHVLVKQGVNGINLNEDVMTTNTDQYSEASMTFKDKLQISGDLNLNGRLGSVNVEAEMVTLNGKHVITGTQSFPDGLIAEKVLVSLLDGVDVVDLNSRAFKTSGDQVVTGQYSFSRPLYTQDIFVNEKINGLDIQILSDTLVRVDKQSEVAGIKIFSNDLAVKETLTVGGLLDGCKVPQDFVTSSEPHTITGRKVFKGQLSAGEISVLGKVDGISFPEDIVTLSTDQILTNSFRFLGGITVENDISVSGLVDGVDISELAKTSLKLNGSGQIQDITFLESLTILNNLEVAGTVNGLFLEEMIKDMVFKEDHQVVVTASKHFTRVTAESVLARKLVNGYNLQTDFMTVFGDQEISGVKTFKNPVTFQNVITDDNTVDGIDVKELEENIANLSIDNRETDILEFADSLTIHGNLQIHGRVNGISFPEDVVLKNTNQTVEGKTFVNDIYVQDMMVEGLALISDTFAGVDLEDFEMNRVTLSQNEDINGNLVLGDNTAHKVQVYSFENGTDIQELAANIMSLTKDQTVNSSKNFLSHVNAFGDITSNGINGVRLDAVKEHAFKLHETNFVTSHFLFDDSLITENLTVHGLVKGINLTDLYLDSAKKEAVQQYFTKDNTFAKGFHVEGNIFSSDVNGTKFPDSVLTKSTSQTIKGAYSLLPSAMILGNLSIDGLLSGIKLSEMNVLLAKRDHRNVIESDLVFTKSVNILKDIQISRFFNEVNLGIFSDSTEEQYIPGHKTLVGNVTVYGDIDVTLVNGVNWLEFLSDVVRIDIPQNVQALKTFSSDIDIRGDIYVSGHASVGFINELSLQQFQDQAVFVNRPANISGVKVFVAETRISSDVIAELVNGLNIKKDVIILQCADEGVQHIKGSKTFRNLTVMGDIYVEDLVNGLRLKTLFDDTLTIDRDQEIAGHKVFLNRVTFKKDVSTHTVNGVRIGEDFFTLGTDQRIAGNLEFIEDVEILGNLDVYGSLNGVNIDELAKDVLYVDANQTVTGSFDVDQVTVHSEIVLSGLLNNEDVEGFSKSVYDFYNESYSRRQFWSETVNSQCRETKALLSLLESSYNVLDGFVPLQGLNYSDTFRIHSEYDELILFQTEKSGSSLLSLSYKYDTNDGRFKFLGANRESVVKTKTYRTRNHTLIFNFDSQGTGSSIELNGKWIKKIPPGFYDASALFVDSKFWIALLYPTGLCEILSLSSSTYGNLEILANLFVGAEATALVMFEALDHVFLAISRKYVDPTAQGSSLIFSWREEEWQRVQTIPAPSSSDVIYFKHNRDHFLVFLDATPFSDSRETMALQVYRHSGNEEHPFRLFQKVPFDNAKGLDVFKHGNLDDLYMTTFNATVVQVFLLEGEAGFTTVFTLPFPCIHLSRPVILDGELFLVVSQKSEDGRPDTLVYSGLTQGPKTQRKELYCQ